MPREPPLTKAFFPNTLKIGSRFEAASRIATVMDFS
jgi:hypothetical protein